MCATRAEQVDAGQTVEYVRAYLHETFGVPFTGSALTYEGRTLIDTMSLCDFGLCLCACASMCPHSLDHSDACTLPARAHNTRRVPACDVGSLWLVSALLCANESQLHPEPFMLNPML